MEGNILLKERTQTINNKIKLHTLEVPINKLGTNMELALINLELRLGSSVTLEGFVTFKQWSLSTRK